MGSNDKKQVSELLLDRGQDSEQEWPLGLDLIFEVHSNPNPSMIHSSTATIKLLKG